MKQPPMTPYDLQVRLQLAQAQWATLLTDGPAHKRADTVQTLALLAHRIDGLTMALARLAE
ncbi:MAG: hypothetical protein JO247_05345 [Chloroflexi bacterium]|nr:hypothetical protein [Chloroflexota bacterium]